MAVRDQHVEEELLEGYAQGTLPATEIAGLEEHLLVCPLCQESLMEIDDYLRAMCAAASRARREERSRAAPRLTWFRPAWGLAAAVVLVLVAAATQMRLLHTRPAPVEVVLEAMRGPESVRVPAHRAVSLSLDTTGLPAAASYRVEMVDERGKVLMQLRAAARGGRVGLPVAKGLTAGRYFVRLYAPSEELLREFGLSVTP